MAFKINPKKLTANHLQVDMLSTNLFIAQNDVAIGIASNDGEWLIQQTNFEPLSNPVLNLDPQRPPYSTGIQEGIHSVRLNGSKMRNPRKGTPLFLDIETNPLNKILKKPRYTDRV